MTKQPTPRMRKVNEILREVIADEMVNLKDPRIGFLTVTGVDAAPDLRNARVFYSVLGTDEEQRDTPAALDSAAPRIQRAMRGQVRMKYLPKLKFVVDDSVAQGARIEELLREVRDTGERDDQPEN